MSNANPPSKDQPFGPFERMLAFRYLRAKREHGGVALIAIISFVGITLAVAALVIVMSVMNGFRSELIDRVLGTSAHVKVQVEEWSVSDVEWFASEIRSWDGVENAYPVIEGQVLATQSDLSFGALIRGLPSDIVRDLDFVKSDMRLGGVENFGLGERGGRNVLIGDQLAVRINAFPGRDITLMSPTCRRTVAGCAPPRKSYAVEGVFRLQAINPLDQFVVLMPIEQAKLFLQKRNDVDAIEIRLDEPEETGPVFNRVMETLPSPAYVYAWDTSPDNAAFMNALVIERLMMRLVFLVLITITTLNIITGVVMLVKNKGRDIAILRTVGASRGTITRVFVMVGAVLGLTGTIVGLAIGLVFCWNIEPIQDGLRAIGMGLPHTEVYGIPYLPAKIDWFEISLATGWAFIMSVVVTIWPAWRAAQMDPVEALRFE